MKKMTWFKSTAAAAVLSGTFFSVCAAAGASGKIPSTILMDGQMLARSKQRIETGDAALKPAMDTLIKQADEALGTGPFSVMDKTRLPPGGDKHDYVSYARYWWPDPDQPDGLPYIRRDGETNPDSQSPAESDRSVLEDACINSEILTMAYYLTGNEAYAKKAAQQLRTWFLTPETRMNPNLNYSQGIPGKEDGTKSGVLDGRLIIRALDASLLIADSPAWSTGEQEGLRKWAARYLNWLKTAEIAQQEGAAKNNHGTFFDVQTMYLALFSGDTACARQIAQQAVEKRILLQIEPDGSMPEELARTRSLHYSIFNLQAMFLVAHLAGQVGVDLWHVGDSRIKTALDYLVPYTDPSKPWPIKEVKDADRYRFFPILLQAADIYQDNTYLQAAENLPLAERETQRANLVVPLMR